MQYRTMPRDTREYSALGMGVMRIPLRGGLIDRKKADAVMDAAVAGGVNYLDTAWNYLAGQSEPYVGRYLEERGIRDKVAIATKLAHWQCRSRADMEKMLGEQLKKLRTDRIDCYLVHNIVGESWNSLLLKDVLGFLDDARKSGKILKAGFSWHGTPEDFTGVVDCYDWDFCQIQYNLLDEKRQAGTAGLEYAAGKGLGVVVMEPLRGGKLATKIPTEASDIWKERPEKTPAAWALDWVWNRPEVTVVLSGFSRISHVEETLKTVGKALPGTLDDKELEMIGRVRDAYRAAGAIDCTSCRYCMPCPFGVSIPEVFDWYNEWKTVRHEMSQRLFYLATVGGVVSGRSGLARHCTSCGACLPKCPQSLPIPDLMKQVAGEYEGGLARVTDFVGRVRNRGRIQKKEDNER